MNQFSIKKNWTLDPKTLKVSQKLYKCDMYPELSKLKCKNVKMKWFLGQKLKEKFANFLYLVPVKTQKLWKDNLKINTFIYGL